MPRTLTILALLHLAGLSSCASLNEYERLARNAWSVATDAEFLHCQQMIDAATHRDKPVWGQTKIVDTPSGPSSLPPPPPASPAAIAYYVDMEAATQSPMQSPAQSQMQPPIPLTTSSPSAPTIHDACNDARGGSETHIATDADVRPVRVTTPRPPPGAVTGEGSGVATFHSEGSPGLSPGLFPYGEARLGDWQAMRKLHDRKTAAFRRGLGVRQRLRSHDHARDTSMGQKQRKVARQSKLGPPVQV